MVEFLEGVFYGTICAWTLSLLALVLCCIAELFVDVELVSTCLSLVLGSTGVLVFTGIVWLVSSFIGSLRN